MIICSDCGNQMESELRFCTECGAENPTLAPTLVTARIDAAQGSETSESSQPRDHPQTQGASAVSSPRQFSSSVLIAFVLGAVVLLLVGGIASRFLFVDNRNDNSLVTAQTPAPENNVTPSSVQRDTQTRSQPTPQQSERALPQPTEPPLVDNRALKREVEDTLNGWTATVREHDLERHMSYYGDTLSTYYLRHGVSANYVRSSRSPTFTRYHTLDAQLNNIAVTIDPSGTTATTTFDKTFRFEGDKVLSGSVRQEVTLTKISGRWLITGERDTHVYYVNR